MDEFSDRFIALVVDDEMCGSGHVPIVISANVDYFPFTFPVLGFAMSRSSASRFWAPKSDTANTKIMEGGMRGPFIRLGSTTKGFWVPNCHAEGTSIDE